MAFEFIDQALAAKAQDALLRQRVCIEKASARHIQVDGTQYLNFASNDYLALADMPISSSFNPGSKSSALVTGYQRTHRLFEAKLCDLLGFERAMLFASGFAANFSVISALFNDAKVGQNSAVFQDKLNHASLIDGSLNSQAKLVRFNHNDMGHLRSRLEKSNAENKLVISEGIFSMDGDGAPLNALQQLAQMHKAWLMIDDAHSFGVCGQNGLGSIESGVRPDILVITFGKAMGCQGAAVLSSKRVIEYMLQCNREYTYSTAISPALVDIASTQLSRLCDGHKARSSLKTNIELFKKLAIDAGIALKGSDSAIQPVILGGAESTLDAQRKLSKKGIWLTAIRPPTVPHNTSRLRVTLTAAHQREDIEYLVRCLEDVL
ncbi:8-amino-7-oxononanoate synthase [Pseudoalteromonas luteoviolacea]|uniref:aminotransferase class I/II-fold pyridoxal phosphate-dependent enzyme n=1 Tax=Pseudoalteromonas luteoviolacea TaxID=43657 RepID=UPI001B387BD4|nr:8-amino-7-oxononanoate synthase [Pseudoalteromonas luteoviolacea]MBQ4809798.1 8-amino-7-oxononanoate synthase [Pseudoalteromonas luteoviolacea]